jgi:hypothetical protein
VMSLGCLLAISQETFRHLKSDLNGAPGGIRTSDPQIRRPGALHFATVAI